MGARRGDGLEICDILDFGTVRCAALVAETFVASKAGEGGWME